MWVGIIGCWCNKTNTNECWWDLFLDISVPYCFKWCFQTPLSSLSQINPHRKQTTRKCKHSSVRSIPLHSSKGESTVLQSSPSRDQLNQDFQNKLECYFPWVKSVETDGYVLMEIQWGWDFTSRAKVLRTPNYLVVVVQFWTEAGNGWTKNGIVISRH